LTYRVELEDLSTSLQDYLEAVLILSRKHKVARVKDVARHLRVKPASVVAALKTLGDKGLLVHERYGYVELTPAGVRVAGRVFRRS